MDMEKIGRFLKGLRKEKDLTQEELAEILLVSGRTISRWETGKNMPDLSILLQMAEFYEVEIKEILDGERKSAAMDKELKETLSRVADYSKLEKEKAAKAGDTAFGMTFTICAVVIVVQLVFTGDLTIVAGETATLIAGGVIYGGIMLYNGIWENGSGFKSTPFRDLVTSVMCSGIFTAALVFYYIRSGADSSQTAHIAGLFFSGTTALGFGVLRILAWLNCKRKYIIEQMESTGGTVHEVELDD